VPAARRNAARGRVVFQRKENEMIRKLKSGQYRLYSRKVNPETGKRRNLGTFDSREAAEKHEREVQYFKRH
jgi:cell division septation protein DedD